MPELEDVEQPRRYCPSCGTEARPGHAFCASCGERLEPETGGTETKTDEPDETSSAKPPLDPWATVKRAGSWRSRVDYEKYLERLKALPLGFKVGMALMGAALLFTVLSPLGLAVAVLLFGAAIVGTALRVGQRKSCKGWAIIAGPSLVAIFVFLGISYAFYGDKSSGNAVDLSNVPHDQDSLYGQGSPQADNGPSPELEEAMSVVLDHPYNFMVFTPNLPNTPVFDENGLTDQGRTVAAETVGRACVYAATNLTTSGGHGQPTIPDKLTGFGVTLVNSDLQRLGLPITAAQALPWARAYQKDPKNWWRYN